MIQGFYNATLGASEQMKRLEVQGNNIANVNTHGFKEEVVAFSELIYRDLEGVDGNNLPKGSAAIIMSTHIDFSQGAIESTGRMLDYAINGDGFFAVEDNISGETLYTRDGSFVLSQEDGPDGQLSYLTDGNGKYILDENLERIIVTNASEVQPVGVFKVQYKEGLLHVNQSTFTATEQAGIIEPLENANVLTGFLESSGTELATEIGKVIETQRLYTYALRMVTTSDEIESTINNLSN